MFLLRLTRIFLVFGKSETNCISRVPGRARDVLLYSRSDAPHRDFTPVCPCDVITSLWHVRRATCCSTCHTTVVCGSTWLRGSGRLSRLSKLITSARVCIYTGFSPPRNTALSLNANWRKRQRQRFVSFFLSGIFFSFFCSHTTRRWRIRKSSSRGKN